MVEKSPQITPKDLYFGKGEAKPLLDKAFELLDSIPQGDFPHCSFANTVAFLVLKGNEAEFLEVGDYAYHDPYTKRDMIRALPELRIFREKHPELFKKESNN